MSEKKDIEAEESMESMESVLNMPPSTIQGFTAWRTDCLSYISRNLPLSMLNLDVNVSMQCVGVLSRLVELKFQLCNERKIEYTRMLLTLLFEHDLDHNDGTTVMSVITKLIKCKSLDLVLDWKPFYDLIRRVHYAKDGVTITDSGAVLKSHGVTLAALIRKARHYFNRNSVQEIYAKILPLLNPFDREYAFALAALNNFLPSRQSWVSQEIAATNPPLIPRILHEVMHENAKSSSMVAICLQLLSRLAKHNSGIMIPYEDTHFDELFHIFLDSLSLPVGDEDNRVPVVRRLDGGLSYFASNKSFEAGYCAAFSRLIVSCMRGRDSKSVMNSVALFDGITNLFYPSRNNARYASTLGSFLSYFTLYLCRRYHRENTKDHAAVDRNHPLFREIPSDLTLNVCDELIDKLLPICRFAVYGKNRAMVLSGHIAIRALGTVWPEKVVQFGTYEIDECLNQSLSQSHRIDIGIGLCSSLSVLLCDSQLVPNGGPALLSCLDACLQYIDATLKKQTVEILSFFDDVFSRVPILSGDEYGDELEENRLGNREATLMFSDWCDRFMEKIFVMVSDSHGASARGTAFVLRKTMNSFFWSLSVDIKRDMTAKAMRYVLRDAPIESGSLAGAILSCAVSADQTGNVIREAVAHCAKKLLDLKAGVSERVDEFGNVIYNVSDYSLRASKEVILFVYKLVDSCLVNGAQLRLESMRCVLDTLCVMIDLGSKHGKRVVKRHAFTLLANVMKCLLRAKPTELRPLSKQYWKESDVGEDGWKHWNDWSAFGRLEMNGFKRGDIPDLDVEWFVPDSASVAAAQHVMNVILRQGLMEIHAFVNDLSGNVYPPAAEELMTYIRLMNACAGGSCDALGSFDGVVEGDVYDCRRKSERRMFESELEFHVFRVSDGWSTDGCMLHLDGYDGMSLRTALTRLCVRLFGKLAMFSDSEDDAKEKEKEDGSGSEDGDGDDDDDATPTSTDVDEMNGNGNGNGNGNEVNPEMIEKLMVMFQSAGGVISDEMKERIDAIGANAGGGGIDMSQLLTMASAFAGNLPPEFASKLSELQASEEAEKDVSMTSAFENKKNKKKEYAGRSKVLSWMGTLAFTLLNHGSVSWNLVSESSKGMKMATRLSHDFVSGLPMAVRKLWVMKSYVLYLKRLYFVTAHDVYTTDVDDIFNALTRTCLSEFVNVRRKCISAWNTRRALHNYGKAGTKLFDDFVAILNDRNSSKHELLAACQSLRSATLISELVVTNVDRHRVFLRTMLHAHVHREPKVQDGVHTMLMRYIHAIRFWMVRPCMLKLNDENENSLMDASRREAMSRETEENVTTWRLIMTDLVEFATSENVSVENASSSFVVDTSWRYKVMATALMFHLLRPDLLPPICLVEYLISIVDDELQQLRSLALIGLTVICGSNYFPKLKSDDLNDSHLLCYFPHVNREMLSDQLSPKLTPFLENSRATYSTRQIETLKIVFESNMSRILNGIKNDHAALSTSGMPMSGESKSDKIMSTIGLSSHWPYDGWSFTGRWFVTRHARLIRDLCRIDWGTPSQSQVIWNEVLTRFSELSASTDEKEDQVSAAELGAGMIRASHHLIPMGICPVDDVGQQVVGRMMNAMKKCRTESEDSWCSALRVSLYCVDVERCAPVMQRVMDDLIETLIALANSESHNIAVEKQVRMIRYMCEFIVSHAFRDVENPHRILTSICESEEIFDFFMCNAFKQVKEDFSICLFFIVRALRRFDDQNDAHWNVMSDPVFASFMDRVKTRFYALMEQDDVKEDESGSSSKLDNLIQTLSFWVMQCFSNGRLSFLNGLMIELCPLILMASHRDDKTTKILAKAAASQISWSLFDGKSASALLKMICGDELVRNDNWFLRRNWCAFMKVFATRHEFLFSIDECDFVVNTMLVDILLQDVEFDVRMAARDVLVGLISNSRLRWKENEGVLSSLSARLFKMAGTKLKLKRRELSREEMDVRRRKKHGGVLGLSAFILSHPQSVPPWMPEMLSFLTRLVNEPNPISTTARKTLDEFKRTHHDQWAIFKREFSREQLEDLNDVTAFQSYFV